MMSIKTIERLAAVLKSEYGVKIGNVYDPPCHLYSFYRKGEICVTRAGLATSEEVLVRTITLPMRTGLTLKEVCSVVESVRRALNSQFKRMEN